jgi:hypothetical protein
VNKIIHLDKTQDQVSIRLPQHIDRDSYSQLQDVGLALEGTIEIRFDDHGATYGLYLLI